MNKEEFKQEASNLAEAIVLNQGIDVQFANLEGELTSDLKKVVDIIKVRISTIDNMPHKLNEISTSEDIMPVIEGVIDEDEKVDFSKLIGEYVNFTTEEESQMTINDLSQGSEQFATAINKIIEEAIDEIVKDTLKEDQKS